MKLRTLLTCLLMGACASTPVYAPPLGVALACSAESATICPPGGCREPGPQSRAPVSITVPAGNERGRYCTGSSCQDVAVRPTLTRALGWTAEIWGGSDFSRLMGELQIGSERRTFLLRQSSGNALYVWSGVCNAAGS
ncbi:MAG: hypothetical protein AB7P07_03020 [Hyphomonadaceae bacterium]